MVVHQCLPNLCRMCGARNMHPTCLQCHASCLLAGIPACMCHCSGCQGLANGLLPCVTASTRLLYLYYSYYSTSLACTTAPPHVSQARHGPPASSGPPTHSCCKLGHARDCCQVVRVVSKTLDAPPEPTRAHVCTCCAHHRQGLVCTCLRNTTARGWCASDMHVMHAWT